MTDKEQIIIDGVDVSGCKYLPYCNDKQGNCGFESNCYFKQLARKTQEYEKLKEDYKELEQRCDELGTFCDGIYTIFPVDDECDITDEEHLLIIKELNRWNEDAFKCWEELNDILHGDYRYYGIDPEYIVDLVKKKLRLRFANKLREYSRYRKALEEIKKVCIKDTREFADGTTVRYDALDDILDIINKVKGEGNE